MRGGGIFSGEERLEISGRFLGRFRNLPMAESRKTEAQTGSGFFPESPPMASGSRLILTWVIFKVGDMVSVSQAINVSFKSLDKSKVCRCSDLPVSDDNESPVHSGQQRPYHAVQRPVQNGIHPSVA